MVIQLSKFLDTQFLFKYYFMNHFILFSQLKRFSHESSRTLKLGMPVIIAQLLQTLMQFVDTVMTGHVSSKDLAGLAIATALYHPVFLLMLGI